MDVCEEDHGNIQQDSEPKASSKDEESMTNKDEKSTELKGKAAVTVSIDVTKALLLLGLPTWSSLEPGKYIFS